MKKIILMLVTVLALIMMMGLSMGTSLAQTATATPKASTTYNSSVTIFAVICENQAVVNLSGTMEPILMFIIRSTLARRLPVQP